VIVSAPAPAALHVPVVPPATSLDPKDPSASKTIPFRNVFDSLALFDDLEHEGGARQGGAAVPNSSTKQERFAQPGPGTEALVVPQAPRPSLPKLPLNLPESARISTPEEAASAEETAPLPPTSSSEQSGVQGAAAVTNTLAPPVAVLPYTPLPYSPTPSKARQDMPTSTSNTPLRNGIPAKSAEAPTTLAPAKKQIVAALFELESAVEPEPAQQSATSTSQPKSAVLVVAEAQSIAKPFAASSVSSLQPAPATAEPGKEKAAGLPTRVSAPTIQPSMEFVAPPGAAPTPRDATGEDRTARKVTVPTQPAIGSQPAGLPTPASAPATRPSASLTTERPVTAKVRVPQSAAVAPAALASVNPPADESSPVEEKLPAGNSSESAPPATPPKPAERSFTANASAPSPEQTPGPVQISAPPQQIAPAPLKPVATTQPLGEVTATSPTVPPSTVLFPEREPLAPLTTDGDVMDRASQQEALAVSPAPKIPLSPQAENFAFAVRMLGLESSPNNSSVTPSMLVSKNDISLTPPRTSVTALESLDSQQPVLPESQAFGDPQREGQPMTPLVEKSDLGAQNLSNSLGTPQTPGVTPHWNDTAIWSAPVLGSMPGAPESAEPAHSSLPMAAGEAHLLAPEMPKTSASSEILLHLTGNDQSAAAIRVTDRAGSVNVSVHASDPVLREALRSNLGALSTQLNDQGWKADVMKTAAVATQSGGQQDSHEGSQRGSQEQQSFGGDRQPQRDRRSSGGQWQQELDQQISGGDAHPGGNG